MPRCGCCGRWNCSRAAAPTLGGHIPPPNCVSPRRGGTLRPGSGDGAQHCPDFICAFERGKQFFGYLQGGFHPLQVPDQGECPGFLNSQPGTDFRLKIDGIGPVQQGGDLAAHEQETAIFFDQVRSPIMVTGSYCILDGFSDKSVLLVPSGSAAVQPGKQTAGYWCSRRLRRTSAKRW